MLSVSTMLSRECSNELLSLISLVVLFSSVTSAGISAFHPTSQRRVLDALLTEDYDVNEWPDADDGKATDVSIQMFINSFGSLNAANMDYSIDLFLRQRWHDPRLVYNDTRDQITITAEEYRNKIWKPDTYFENVKEASLHQITMPNILLRIYRSGDILYSMRVTVKLGCPLQLGDFPFDEQTCTTAFASYAYTADVIKYLWHKEKPIDLPDSLEIAQFDFLEYWTNSFIYEFTTGNFSGVKVAFVLRRQNGYHIVQTYIPTILIVSISWVSFWLDPNAVPARVSLGVTTLLTLTTLASGIRSTLPPVSYVKAIDVWIGVCMIMVFAALLEFTFVNWLGNKKITPSIMTSGIFKIPKTLSASSEQFAKASEEDNCSKEAEDEEGENSENEAQEKTTVVNLDAPPATYINYARDIDTISRAAFPGFFLFFNILYWPIYLIN